MISGLCILYVGLQLLDLYFDFHWKEFTVGIICLSTVITILCLIHLTVISGIIWLVITLVEYRTYLMYIKD